MPASCTPVTSQFLCLKDRFSRGGSSVDRDRGAYPLPSPPLGQSPLPCGFPDPPPSPHRKCSRGALYTGFSVLVALLLAGQATTAYFLYQQQDRLDKLTVTSQKLQLESLRMKLPKCACPTFLLRLTPCCPTILSLNCSETPSWCWDHTHAIFPVPQRPSL